MKKRLKTIDHGVNHALLRDESKRRCIDNYI